MNIIQTRIHGCFEIQPDIHRDNRGTFIKTFHESAFKESGLTTSFAEEYHSLSKKGVLRGLHFQIPPHDHIKVIYAASGKIFDAIVDLRVGSPTYGEHAIFELSDENASLLYLPSGIAHGFYVLSDYALVMYKVTTTYAPEHDTGILWNSVGIPWPDTSPIMSERDKTFPSLDEFDNPFFFGPKSGEGEIA